MTQINLKHKEYTKFIITILLLVIFIYPVYAILVPFDLNSDSMNVKRIENRTEEYVKKVSTTVCTNCKNANVKITRDSRLYAVNETDKFGNVYRVYLTHILLDIENIDTKPITNLEVTEHIPALIATGIDQLTFAKWPLNIKEKGGIGVDVVWSLDFLAPAEHKKLDYLVKKNITQEQIQRWYKQGAEIKYQNLSAAEIIYEPKEFMPVTGEKEKEYIYWKWESTTAAILFVLVIILISYHTGYLSHKSRQKREEGAGKKDVHLVQPKQTKQTKKFIKTKLKELNSLIKKGLFDEAKTLHAILIRDYGIITKSLDYKAKKKISAKIKASYNRLVKHMEKHDRRQAKKKHKEELQKKRRQLMIIQLKKLKVASKTIKEIAIILIKSISKKFKPKHIQLEKIQPKRIGGAGKEEIKKISREEPYKEKERLRIIQKPRAIFKTIKNVTLVPIKNVIKEFKKLRFKDVHKPKEVEKLTKDEIKKRLEQYGFKVMGFIKPKPPIYEEKKQDVLKEFKSVYNLDTEKPEIPIGPKIEEKELHKPLVLKIYKPKPKRNIWHEFKELSFKLSQKIDKYLKNKGRYKDIVKKPRGKEDIIKQLKEAYK